MDVTLDPTLIASFLGIAIFTGLLSSAYPALYLSSFNPVVVLKGKLTSSLGELWTRKGLVIFQFSISVFLIVSVLVIYRQTALIRSKNLGYNRDNIIHIVKEGALKENLESFLTEVKKLPGVSNATNSNENLIGNQNFTTGIEWQGKAPTESLLLNVFVVNYNYIETFNIGLKEGRSFSPMFGRDTSKVILNEAAVKAMRLSDPIGKTVKFWGKDMQVIGVTNDFLYQSLHKRVEPCIFRLFQQGDNYGNQIYIKVSAGSETAAIEGIRKTYQQFNPGFPFEFKFIEDDYQALYESENRVAVLSKYFAGVAIIITCLGLFGLAAFTAQKRQKEIGIRKIVGASAANIALLLSTDFLRLVLIAIVIAFPLAWWVMNEWLHGFAYRTDISMSVFLLAGSAILFITLLTISFQSIRASMANPVKSLRAE
jgi:ABC-type antimicrobial peptide transport system permease subunit